MHVGAAVGSGMAKISVGEPRTASRDVCQVSREAPCELTASQRLRKNEYQGLQRAQRLGAERLHGQSAAIKRLLYVHIILL